MFTFVGDFQNHSAYGINGKGNFPKSQPEVKYIIYLNIATMSYLKFEKAQMTNLQESLRRELLCTNRSGAYSCSTVVDCNTRK